MLDKERHLLFSLNAIDEMQDKFGGFDRLDTVLSGKDSIKNLRWLLTVLLNEGAADDEEPLTEFCRSENGYLQGVFYGQQRNARTARTGRRGRGRRRGHRKKRNSGQGIIDLARLLYIGVTLLRWSEAEVWRMTPYKILTLFKIHREFNPDRFKPVPKEVDIDDVLGGI